MSADQFPIPNTEVKPSGAAGTARGAERESSKITGLLERFKKHVYDQDTRLIK